MPIKIATRAFLFSAVTLLLLSSLLAGSSEICHVLFHINPFTRLSLLSWLLKIPGSAQANYVPDTAASKPSSGMQSSTWEQWGAMVLQKSTPVCSTCFNLRYYMTWLRSLPIQVCLHISEAALTQTNAKTTDRQREAQQFANPRAISLSTYAYRCIHF